MESHREQPQIKGLQNQDILEKFWFSLQQPPFLGKTLKHFVTRIFAENRAYSVPPNYPRAQFPNMASKAFVLCLCSLLYLIFHLQLHTAVWTACSSTKGLCSLLFPGPWSNFHFCVEHSFPFSFFLCHLSQISLVIIMFGKPFWIPLITH